MGEERRGGKTLSNIRLNFIVEGQTEETFVNKQLVPHLAQKSIWASVRCVQTSRKRNIKYRGGLGRYAQASGDISRWMRQESGCDVRARFLSPELINGDPETAPSKRIKREIPTYVKTTSGLNVTKRIGLPKLRAKCPHFGAWLDKLESLESSV